MWPSLKNKLSEIGWTQKTVVHLHAEMKSNWQLQTGEEEGELPFNIVYWVNEQVLQMDSSTAL